MCCLFGDIQCFHERLDGSPATDKFEFSHRCIEALLQFVDDVLKHFFIAQLGQRDLHISLNVLPTFLENHSHSKTHRLWFPGLRELAQDGSSRVAASGGNGENRVGIAEVNSASETLQIGVRHAGVGGEGQRLALVLLQIRFPLRDAGVGIVGERQIGHAALSADHVDAPHQLASLVDLVVAKILDHGGVVGVRHEEFDKRKQSAVVADQALVRQAQLGAIGFIAQLGERDAGCIHPRLAYHPWAFVGGPSGKPAQSGDASFTSYASEIVDIRCGRILALLAGKMHAVNQGSGLLRIVIGASLRKRVSRGKQRHSQQPNQSCHATVRIASDLGCSYSLY